MGSDCIGPINIGNPDEFTINQLANIIINKVNPDLKVVYKDIPEDDPVRRKPDISLAKINLNWSPSVSLDDGLEKTIEYFRNTL